MSINYTADNNWIYEEPFELIELAADINPVPHDVSSYKEREEKKRKKQHAIVRRRARKSRHKTRAMRKLSKKKNRNK